jgi:hypothetical protein
MCSVCDPAKIFLIYKFSYLLFSNPNHKTKIKTAIRWDRTLGLGFGAPCIGFLRVHCSVAQSCCSRGAFATVSGRFRVLSSSPVSRSSLGRISTKVRNFHLLPSIQSVRYFAYLGRVIVGSKTSEVVILGGWKLDREVSLYLGFWRVDFFFLLTDKIWPSLKITQRITSRTRRTRMASRSQRNISILQEKG